MADTWVDAERVQKNAAGEKRALINGAWVPVQRAQKNAAGKFRVIAPSTGNEPPSAAAQQIQNDPITRGAQAGLRGFPSVESEQAAQNVVSPEYRRMSASVPGSAKAFAGGLYEAARHPVDTAGAMFDAAAGGLRNVVPEAVSSQIDKLDWNPEAAQRASGTADAFGGFYKDRYGSLGQAKNTVLDDPVGAAADASVVLGGAGLAAPKASAIASTLKNAAVATNPLTLALGAAKTVGTPAAKLAGWATKQGLGLSTGTGAESIANAAKAGRSGSKAFLQNLNREVPFANVVDDMKQALAKMRQSKSDSYRSGMVDISNDATVLDFAKIDDAVRAAKGITHYKGQVVNAKAAKAVSKMSEIVEDWLRLDQKQFHTPEGFDVLKQKLGGILETIPFEQKTARAAAGKIYHATKETINKQAPAYAKVMKDYTRASDLISEIERSLSLGKKAAADTSLRKLQSVLRDNVNTNYGNRLDLTKQLIDQGGKDVLPALAGQTMSSWVPRGLIGQGGALGTVGYSMFANPSAAAALPFLSPKAVGLGAYGAGRAARMFRLGSDKVNPDAARFAALLAQRGAAANQE